MACAGGFTLIEVLVSLVILSVCLVAILGAFQVSLRALAESRESLISTMLLAERLADIRGSVLANPGQPVPCSIGHFAGDYSDYQWEQESTGMPTPSLEGMEGQGRGVLYGVVLRVWRGGSDRKHVMSTLVWAGKKDRTDS
jgi:prepilin-type N-terminal cleavage/methylation domain-containing protein